MCTCVGVTVGCIVGIRFETGTGIKPEPESLEPEYLEPVSVPGLKISFIRVARVLVRRVRVNWVLDTEPEPLLEAGTGFWETLKHAYLIRFKSDWHTFFFQCVV